MLPLRRRNPRRRGLTLLLLLLVLLAIFYGTLFRLHLSLGNAFAALPHSPPKAPAYAIFTVLPSAAEPLPQWPTVVLPKRSVLLNSLRSWARLRPAPLVLVLTSASLNLTATRGLEMKALSFGLGLRYLPILPAMGAGIQPSYSLASLLHRVLTVSGSANFLIYVKPSVVLLAPFAGAVESCLRFASKSLQQQDFAVVGDSHELVVVCLPVSLGARHTSNCISTPCGLRLI